MGDNINAKNVIKCIANLMNESWLTKNMIDPKKEDGLKSVIINPIKVGKPKDGFCNLIKGGTDIKKMKQFAALARPKRAAPTLPTNGITSVSFMPSAVLCVAINFHLRNLPLTTLSQSAREGLASFGTFNRFAGNAIQRKVTKKLTIANHCQIG